MISGVDLFVYSWGQLTPFSFRFCKLLKDIFKGLIYLFICKFDNLNPLNICKYNFDPMRYIFSKKSLIACQIKSIQIKAFVIKKLDF